MKGQQTLDTGEAGRRQVWADDFRKYLPNGVMPTTLHTLRAGTSILHVTYVGYGQVQLSKTPRGKSLLLKALHRLGSWHVDCPGTVTLFVVSGTDKTMRDLVVVDHQGEHAPERMTTDELGHRIREWFDTHNLR